MFPKPWYRPPCEGGKSAGRDAFACPRPAKNDSFAAFWSGNEPVDGFGVPAGDDWNGELVRLGVPRVDARDFRRPWAEDGRFGGLVVPDGDAALTGGEEGDHGLPARSASS